MSDAEDFLSIFAPIHRLPAHPHLNNVAANLPDTPAGHQRVYRVQVQNRAPGNFAWYTPHLQHLPFYANKVMNNGHNSEMRYLDLPNDTFEKTKVTNQPKLIQMFSKAPNIEHLIPAELHDNNSQIAPGYNQDKIKGFDYKNFVKDSDDYNTLDKRMKKTLKASLKKISTFNSSEEFDKQFPRKVDNPGGEWEKENPDTITAWHEPNGQKGMGTVPMPTQWLANLPGRRDEQTRIFPGNEKVQRLKQSITEKGYDPNQPVAVDIDYAGKPWVYEGNHRSRAAFEAGLSHIPTELRYLGGGEKYFHPYSAHEPKKAALLSILKHAYENKVSPEEAKKINKEKISKDEQPIYCGKCGKNFKANGLDWRGALCDECAFKKKSKKNLAIGLAKSARIGEEKDFFTSPDGGGVADAPQKTFGPEFIQNELMPMEGVELSVQNDPRPTNEADETIMTDPSVIGDKDKTPDMNKGRTYSAASDIHFVYHGNAFLKSARDMNNPTPFELFNLQKNRGTQFDNVPYLNHSDIIDHSFNDKSPSNLQLSPDSMENVDEIMYPDEELTKHDMSMRDFGTGDQSSDPTLMATTPFAGNLDTEEARNYSTRDNATGTLLGIITMKKQAKMPLEPRELSNAVLPPEGLEEVQHHIQTNNGLNCTDQNCPYHDNAPMAPSSLPPKRSMAARMRDFQNADVNELENITRERSWPWRDSKHSPISEDVMPSLHPEHNISEFPGGSYGKKVVKKVINPEAPLSGQEIQHKVMPQDIAIDAPWPRIEDKSKAISRPGENRLINLNEQNNGLMNLFTKMSVQMKDVRDVMETDLPQHKPEEEQEAGDPSNLFNLLLPRKGKAFDRFEPHLPTPKISLNNLKKKAEETPQMGPYGWIGPQGEWYHVPRFGKHDAFEPEIYKKYNQPLTNSGYAADGGRFLNHNFVHVSPSDMRLPKDLNEHHVGSLMNFWNAANEGHLKDVPVIAKNIPHIHDTVETAMRQLHQNQEASGARSTYSSKKAKNDSFKKEAKNYGKNNYGRSVQCRGANCTNSASGGGLFCDNCRAQSDALKEKGLKLETKPAGSPLYHTPMKTQNERRRDDFYESTQSTNPLLPKASSGGLLTIMQRADEICPTCKGYAADVPVRDWAAQALDQYNGNLPHDNTGSFENGKWAFNKSSDGIWRANCKNCKGTGYAEPNQ